MPKTKATNPTSADPTKDLVEDRAIEDASADHFGHADFAAQAALTIQAIKTPANIAIYAPWGSGKTSLANLLKADLDPKTCGFVYFDAFKYAEAPLRREFIRRMAQGLKVEDVKFDRGLYEEETRTGFKLDKNTVGSLSKAVIAVALLALALIFIVAVVMAEISGKRLRPEIADDVKQWLPVIFAPAVIVGPLLLLVRSQLDVNRKRYAPQSDEEFESLFKEVVRLARAKNKDWDRLVVFIDELDRCGADEVASTLETLRTFLEVEGCIFVVAADRSVLETAVAKEARQETPYNVKNPYYSVGSSYLDKIFQYQWQLPPMMPSNLTRFAQRLVQERTGGLWDEVNAGLVVSVLVPLHVQSPRRVKELLNAYVMAYRIAERRMADGHLEGDLKERAAELAKLVSLQLEFPVFANDLPNEPRLPQLILDILDARAAGNEPVRPDTVSDDVWRRALAYAEGVVELDLVIAREQAPPLKEDEEAGQPSSPGNAVAHAHAHLLVRYLQKTRRIPGPEPDLIFLEGPGFAFGLPTALTVSLRDAASEGRVPDVVTSLAPLPTEQQQAALQLLAQHVKEAFPGVDGDNALITLLGVIGSLPDLDMSGIVDELADAANFGMSDDRLPDQDLIGAVRLGLATDRPVGSELIGRSLAHNALLTTPSAASFVVGRANDFASAHVPRLGEVVAALMVDLAWDVGAQVVVGWNDQRATEVLVAAQAPLLARVAAAEASLKQGAEEAAAAEAEATASGTAAPASTPVRPVESVKANVLTVLTPMIEAARAADRKVLLEALLELTLAVDSQDARNLVARELPPLGLVASSSLTSAALEACNRRTIDGKAPWLDALDPAIMSTQSNFGARLAELVAHAWSSHADEAVDEVKLGSFQVFATSGSRLGAGLDLPVAEVGAAVAAKAAPPSADQAGMGVWVGRIRVARIYEGEGLLQPAAWRPAFLEAAIPLATNQPPDPEARAAVLGALTHQAVQLAEGMSAEVSDRLDQALVASPWLVATERCLARVELMAARRSGAASDEPVLMFPTAELVAAFDEATTDEASATLNEAIAVWLCRIPPPVADAWEVLDRYGTLEFPDVVRDGVSGYAAQLSRQDRTALARLLLANAPERTPGDALLEAVHFHDSELADTIDLIVEASGRATNEDHRRNVLRLWTALRPTDRALIRQLAERVMRPLVEHGKTSRDLVLQHLNLVQTLADSDKRALTQLFQSQADDDYEWDGARKRLAQAGLMRKRSGGLLKSDSYEHL